MSSKLILITRRFPFFSTEAFLESEIIFLSKSFSEIIIVPSQTSDFKRKVPDNVRVLTDFAVEFQNKRKRAFKAVLSTFFWRSIIHHTKKLKSIKDILLLFRYASNLLCYYNYFSQKSELLNDAIVYTYWLNDSTYAFIKLRERWNKKFNIISRAHRFDIYEGLESTVRFWPYRKETLRNIDRIYSISQDGKDYLQEKYNNAKKIFVSKLGVIDRGEISHRSNDGHLSMVSVSRVAPMKRVDLIYKSISQFATENSSKMIRWTHFGDGEDLEKIRALIKNTIHPNLNVSLKGYVENKAIYDFYATNNVDLFINLSSSEGIPVSIMEAQSFGIPVIATNVGGSSEIVNSKNGVLLKSNPTIAEVIEAINAVIISNFSQKVIRNHWNENFNAEENYSRFTESIMEL